MEQLGRGTPEKDVREVSEDGTSTSDDGGGSTSHTLMTWEGKKRPMIATIII